MAVAFDAVSNVAAGTGNLSWTHTPVGTPRGVRVDIVENGGTNGVDSVTYGGVSMELVAVNAKTSGEAGTVITYFLGKGIPTGAQTVSVTVNDAVSKRAVATTVTAASDTCWISTDFSIASDSATNPSSTLSLLGKTCFVSLALHSGQGAATGITPLTGWTSRLEHDFGAQMGGWYTYNTIASSDVACGWTQTADDAVMIAAAITEAPAITDPARVSLTESASVVVVFDARALPIAILESASLAVVLASTDSATTQASENATALSVSVSVSDSAAVVFIDEADLSTLNVTDSLQVALTDTATLTAKQYSVSDTTVVGSSDTASAISASTAFDVTDSLSVTLADARPSITATDGGLVLSVTDSCAVRATDGVIDLFVFTDSLQNFSVADSLKVQLNGELAPPTQKTASDTLAIGADDQFIPGRQVTASESITVGGSDQSQDLLVLSGNFFVQDSLAIQYLDTAAVEALTILNVSDSIRVQSPEDVPEVVTVFSLSDSLRIVCDEPGDQQTQLGVLDSVAIQISAEVLQIGGLQTLAVSDSAACVASESAYFGSVSIGAVDSCRVAATEILTNSASIAATESLRASLTEALLVFKDLAITESVAAQIADTASPIFDSFIDLTASDSCAIQATESVTELISFLRQLSASDSGVIGISEAITQQFVAALVSDQPAVQADGLASVWHTASVTDSLKVGTVEAGLAIPIVPIGVSAFADDTIFGEIDGDAVVEVVYEAIEKTTSDGIGVQCSEDNLLQPGYYSDDLCLVGVGESAAKESVANATPETWNGHAGTEHRNDKPKPWKYIFTDKLNW